MNVDQKLINTSKNNDNCANQYQYSVTNLSESIFKSKFMSILMIILLLFFPSDLLRYILKCICSPYSTLMTMYLPGNVANRKCTLGLNRHSSPIFTKISFCNHCLHDSGLYIQKILTKWEIVNFKKMTFCNFNNNFCLYSSARIERDLPDITSLA